MSNSRIDNLIWPSLNFLFADESSAVLQETLKFLRSEGHDCVVTNDSQEADRHLDSSQPDVVVLNTLLRGNERLELAAAARALSEPPVVVVVADEPTLETALDGIKLKVDAYLVKPFSAHQLLDVVREAFAERERTAKRRSVSPFYDGGRSEAPPESRHSAEFEIPAHVRRLTRREYEVLQRVLVGDDVAAIGITLFISPHTVRNHLKAIYRKLDVRSRVELVVRFAGLKHEPAPHFLAG